MTYTIKAEMPINIAFRPKLPSSANAPLKCARADLDIIYTMCFH